MVCMIADYKKDGRDQHCEYIAKKTNDRERAVMSLLDELEKGGATVRCISVIPGKYTLDELREIAENPLPSGLVAFAYTF